jgi:hypothetical protein
MEGRTIPAPGPGVSRSARRRVGMASFAGEDAAGMGVRGGELGAVQPDSRT